ncbi:MAG TPA: GAF domain-containing protein [Polyangiaceae bacterium]|nr:GAF domain-containing protein [Polyangiaceae bacterium]
MGARAQSCFDEANRLGGLVAKLRLASIAQVTSTEATARQDTPELTAKLEAALVTVRAEFKVAKAGPAPSQSQEIGVWAAVAKENEGLRRHLGTVADLFSQRSLFLGDVNATVRRMTEAAVFALSVERVSVWFLDDARSKIVCADLFERGKATHSSGVELFAKDFAPYFDALAKERTIAADDANQDPRTKCFSASYLMPLNIGAMLDVPVWTARRKGAGIGAGHGDRRMVGVICCEHVGGTRDWSRDDETFVYVLSTLIAMTLEQGA